MMDTQTERGISTKKGAGVVAVVAGTLVASTIALFSTAASAIDINGIVATAIALNYARLHARLAGSSHAAARRDRDSDDEGDSGGGSRKSAEAPAHRSTTPARRTMEASSGDPADQMTSLSRSHDQ
jgi:hypothetical protein